MSFSPLEFNFPPDRDRRQKRSLEPCGNMGNLRRQRRRLPDSSAFERGPVTGDGDCVFRRNVKDRIFRPPVKKRLAKVPGIHYGNPNWRRKEGNFFSSKKPGTSDKTTKEAVMPTKVEVSEKSVAALICSGNSDACPSRTMAKKMKKKITKASVSSNVPKSKVVVADKLEAEKVLRPCPDERASPLIQKSNTKLLADNDEKVMNSDAGEEASSLNHNPGNSSLNHNSGNSSLNLNSGKELVELGELMKKKKKKKKKIKVSMSLNTLKSAVVGAAKGEAEKMPNPCPVGKASSLIQRSNTNLSAVNSEKVMNSGAGEEASSSNHKLDMKVAELGEFAKKRRKKKIKTSLSLNKLKSTVVGTVMGEAEKVLSPCSEEEPSPLTQWSNSNLGPDNDDKMMNTVANEEALSLIHNSGTELVELCELVREVTDSGRIDEKIDAVVREEEVLEREDLSEPVAAEKVWDGSELHSNGSEQSGEVKLQTDILISFQSSPSEAVEGDKYGSTEREEGSEFLAKTSSEQEVEIFADGLSGIKRPEDLQVVADGHISITPTTGAKDSNLMELDAFRFDANREMANSLIVELNLSEQKIIDPLITDAAPLNLNAGTVSSPEADLKADELMMMDRKRPDKAVLPPLPPTKQSAIDAIISMASSSRATTSTFAQRASFSFGTLKQKASVPKNQIVKRARTWHREGNSHSSPSPSPVHESCLTSTLLHKEPPREHQSQMTSYIRKGNSLVRKASAVNALPQAKTNLKTTCGEERREALETEGSPSHLLERPKTPPLSNNTKFQKCASKALEINSNRVVAPTEFLGNSSTNLNICKLEDQNCLNGEELKTSTKMKKVTYVRRKSNQLVAAPRREISNTIKDKAQESPTIFPADAYYKSKKNQIVRNVAALESHKKLEDSSNLDGQRVTSMLPSMKYGRSFSKRKLEKVLDRPSNSSSVWTLSKDRSDNKDKTTDSLQYRKVLPHLFPWKRPIYYRHSTRNRVVDSDKLSLSVIRKLQLLRKRDTIYTKSKNGFSIRKSRVLSIGGSSLKWSNSIERRSKKASKEATLAVAAAQKKKKERKEVDLTVGISNNVGRPSCKSASGLDLLPGERIFRVGSVRYKMDASNKTLIRILDEKSPSEVDNATMKTFIPRRLVIGNDEYVRVGNGNKLVRDPKRLKRILASEKIRWSLHNARLRWAKKQQYCQFFTRFGKCNKQNGKCPYIHDPDKIAVCTRFLKGLCPGTNCKLTHKVIPERMPDCSYFLRGLCTNEDCPYRHVNVNPDASVCEGFLRGYCADGDECCKKHTHLCPFIETNGTCPQGPACKLHHPKNVNRSKKRKRGEEQKSIKGRYFGSSELIDGVESEISFANGQSVAAAGEDIFCYDGRYTDYISVDTCEEVEEETKDPTETCLISCKSEPSELLLDDLNKLIKPVRIMNQTTL